MGNVLQRLNYPQHVLVGVLGLVDVDVVEVELVVGGAALVLAKRGFFYFCSNFDLLQKVCIVLVFFIVKSLGGFRVFPTAPAAGATTTTTTFTRGSLCNFRELVFGLALFHCSQNA